MVQINFLPKFNLSKDNLKLNSFYVGGSGGTNLYYVFECYVDNIISLERKRYCYTKISTSGEKELTGMFETLGELVSQLKSFSCKPINLVINEIV